MLRSSTVQDLWRIDGRTIAPVNRQTLLIRLVACGIEVNGRMASAVSRGQDRGVHQSGKEARDTMAISSSSDRGVSLTPRQREVLRLQAYGMSYEEISRHLGLSVWTVKNHHKQAVRSLQLSLTVYPSDRVRTTLACYIMGLLDGGVPPLEIVERLREATNQQEEIGRAAVNLATIDHHPASSITSRAAD